MTYVKSVNSYKSNIREFSADNLTIPQSFSLPFIKSENGNSKSVLALEILMNIPSNYSQILKHYWGDCVNDMVKWFEKVQALPCDAVALKFNIIDENEIPKAVELFGEILKIANKTLIVTGSNKKNQDIKLLPQLAKIADKQCIIGIAEEETYKSLVSVISEKNHAIIARTPIDINLAKELNILLLNNGISPDKILIDTNMAALGYGLDYGYSIMEKVKLAGLNGDEMLNMPMIAFVGEEAWKTKESRVDDFENSYGIFEERAIAWESATASSLMLAGANIIVLWHPEVLQGLKQFMEES